MSASANIVQHLLVHEVCPWSVEEVFHCERAAFQTKYLSVICTRAGISIEEAGLVLSPGKLRVPGFGWRLSDQDVAELTTFVRESWGNHALGVSAAQVRKVRDTLAASVATAGVRH